MKTPNFYEKFCNLVNMVKQFGGSVRCHNFLIEEWGAIIRENSNQDEQEVEVTELAEKNA
eukprot:11243726-Ditylum_brightwellii.AAC.1